MAVLLVLVLLVLGLSILPTSMTSAVSTSLSSDRLVVETSGPGDGRKQYHGKENDPDFGFEVDNSNREVITPKLAKLPIGFRALARLKEELDDNIDPMPSPCQGHIELFKKTLRTTDTLEKICTKWTDRAQSKKLYRFLDKQCSRDDVDSIGGIIELHTCVGGTRWVDDTHTKKKGHSNVSVSSHKALAVDGNRLVTAIICLIITLWQGIPVVVQVGL